LIRIGQSVTKIIATGAGINGCRRCYDVWHYTNIAGGHAGNRPYAMLIVDFVDAAMRSSSLRCFRRFLGIETNCTDVRIATLIPADAETAPLQGKTRS
jgi:hypothetical protein